jgi:xylulokinase
MAALILAHDLGTTGDKATLFDGIGTLISSTFASYPTQYPRPGWAEQDANEYWKAFCASTRELLAANGRRASDIAAVSFSGQMQAALPVDASGTPLRPSIIWADQRATLETAELLTRVPAARIYSITGHRASPSYSAAKIMWIRKNEPELFRAVRKFIHAKDFLVLRLTGRLCTDLSDASGMNLLDIEAGQWSTEMLDAAGISTALLPDLYESTSVVGSVTAAASSATGLVQGTPVVVGAGDGACATCGAGVVTPGDTYICLGTSGWMATASRDPLRDPEQRIPTFCHFRRGLYFPCGSMQSAGGALQWFAEAAAAGVTLHDLLEKMAARVPPGSGGLIFLPYLMGERSPWWDPAARGCFIGLSPTHGIGDMARAVMEGVAYNMRLIADIFTDLGMHAHAFRMIGGGARSRTWRGIFCDVLSRPVTTLSYMEEATSVGAAIAGGVGVGLFAGIEEAARIVRPVETIEPDQQRAGRYARGLPVFSQAYRRLAPVFGMLADGEA